MNRHNLKNGTVMWARSIVLLGFLAGFDLTLMALQELPGTQVEFRLDERIPAATPSQYQYRAVREPQDWLNPWLDVTADGFQLKSMSSPEPRFVALAGLGRALIGLPVGDWPYGRVVVVQLPSTGAGIESFERIRENAETARDILRALDSHWWGWPP